MSQKNTILTLILGLFLLTAVSALYAGESTTFDLGQDYEYYSIVGNSSEVVLDIQQNGTWITITPNKYSEDDTYEIIFFDKEKETIIEYRGGGGGGTRTIYKDRNVTEYVNVTEYISGPETIKEVEVEVPGEERIIEVVKNFGTKGQLLIAGLIALVVLLLILYIIKSSKVEEEILDNNYNDYTAEKEVQENE